MKLFIAAATACAATALFTNRQELCGQWDRQVANGYVVYNNLWNHDNDKVGRHCTTVNSKKSPVLAWETHFTWKGDNWQVKSFTNAALTFDPVQISSVTSIPTTIEYTLHYDGNIIANVAYDLFTSPKVTGGEIAYELMVWLAALGGALPLTTTGQTIKTVTQSGVDFDLYQGWNNRTKVFTYVAKTMTTSFKADLKKFFDELLANITIETTQYLMDIQAGTEPFQCNGVAKGLLIG